MTRDLSNEPGDTLRGDQLKPSARAEALRGFLYRNTFENLGENRAAVLRCRSTLCLISDEAWLFHTRFIVTKSGDLKRNCSCEVQHREIPEHKEALDKWASERMAANQVQPC